MSAEMNNMTGPARYTKHSVNKVRAHESIWDRAYNDEKKSNLVRGKSTPNIAQEFHSPTPQRVGSHISAKIRELQLCQEKRKRHVSDSDTSATLEAQTSAETFKDARQIVFLEDTPSLIEPEIVSSNIKTLETSSNFNSKPLAAKHTTSFIPRNADSTKIFNGKSSPQAENLNSKTSIRQSSTQFNTTTMNTKEVPKSANDLNLRPKNTAPIAPKFIPDSQTIPSKLQIKSETSPKTFLPPTILPSTPSVMSTPPMNPEINIENSDSDSEKETILFEKPPEHLHSETIRIRTTSESDQTLELTVTVSQKPSQSKEEINPSSVLSPTKRMQFSLDENAPKPSFKPRRSFVFPNFLRLLPTSNNNRRNSEPLARMKPPRLQDVEDGEILSLKLEAVAVNAAFLLARAQDFCGTVEQLIELEEEIERTQRALDDVEIMAPVNMKVQVARATRSLNACKMLLEERAPSIEMMEIGERRRSSAVAGGEVRSVAMRVMKLNKEEEKWRSSNHDGSP